MRRTHAVQSVLVLGRWQSSRCLVATAGATDRHRRCHKATAARRARRRSSGPTDARCSSRTRATLPTRRTWSRSVGVPGTITVKSGQKLTLVDGDNFGDPHVLVISPKKDLPKGDTAAFKNPVVRVVAPEVLNDPSNPDKGFKALSANRGKPGLNTIGDALVLTHKGAKDLGDRVGQARHHAVFLLRGPLLDAGQDHRQVALTADARLGHGPGRASRLVDQHAHGGERGVCCAVQPGPRRRQLA